VLQEQYNNVMVHFSIEQAMKFHSDIGGWGIYLLFLGARPRPLYPLE